MFVNIYTKLHHRQKISPRTGHFNLIFYYHTIILFRFLLTEIPKD